MALAGRGEKREALRCPTATGVGARNSPQASLSTAHLGAENASEVTQPGGKAVSPGERHDHGSGSYQSLRAPHGGSLQRGILI